MDQDNSAPLLSVRLMVYNNEPFIRQALDGILTQKVNFRYEIVIGDDGSTDGTLAILNSYKEQHPDIIRILDRPEGGKYREDRKRLGRIHNFVDIVDHCRGSYIAILDGDDYWTDPEKLQLQVDFLEAHPDFSICFHQAREFTEDGEETFTNTDQPEVTDGAYLLQKGWHMRSAAVVFRKADLPPWPEWVYSIESMDYTVQCLLTAKGQKIRYLDRCMCDYRVHGGNVSSKLNKDIMVIMMRNQRLLTYLMEVQEIPEYKAVLQARIDHIKTQRFYHYRAKASKSAEDWKHILTLGWALGKFNPAHIAKQLISKATRQQ